MNYFVTENLIEDLYTENNGLCAVCLEGADSYIKHCLLNSLAEESHKKGLFCECFYNENNCDILSAVYIKNKNLFVFDSNEDMQKNALQSGVKIIDTGEVYSHKCENAYISSLCASLRKQNEQVKRLKAVCSKIAESMSSASSAYIDKAKILNYILRFASRYSLRQTGKCGLNYRRQLSSAGAWGVHSFYENIIENTNCTVRVCDSSKALGRLLLCGLKKMLNSCGIDTVSFYCSVDRKPEHLVIPELKIAFFTDNIYHEYPFDCDSELNLRRFLKKEMPADVKNHICRQFEIYDAVIEKIIFTSLQSYCAFEKISDYYYESTDFNLLERLKCEIKGLL